MPGNFVEMRLDSPTGADLRVLSLMPPRGVRASVQILHGMAEHAGRYLRFARHLARQGFAVHVHDHRGHGKTRAADAPQGVFAESHGLDKVIADILAVNDRIRARDPDHRVALFGHSMGAILALTFALRHPERVNLLACWNAGAEGGPLLALLTRLLKIEALARGRAAPSALAQALTFKAWNRPFRPNRTAFDWLSADPAEVDAYVADPDCGFPCSTGLWLDLLEAIRFNADSRNLARLPRDLPVHLVGGADDPSTAGGRHMKRLARRMTRTGMRDVTCTVLPDTRHETLNDIGRDAHMTAFTDWLGARL